MNKKIVVFAVGSLLLYSALEAGRRSDGKPEPVMVNANHGFMQQEINDSFLGAVGAGDIETVKLLLSNSLLSIDAINGALLELDEYNDDYDDDMVDTYAAIKQLLIQAKQTKNNR